MAQARTVESVLNQTFRDFEVLVVDDQGIHLRIWEPHERVNLLRRPVNGGGQVPLGTRS